MCELMSVPHGDHEATCLCCFWVACRYEEHWSSETPGNGLELHCDKGHWSRAREAFDHPSNTKHIGDQLHEVINKAQSCGDYLPRETDPEKARGG